MAKKSTRSKSRSRATEGVLENLDGAEAASVLKALLDRHPELRNEAETIARRMLIEVSMFSVANEVADAMLQFDYDDLNARAGRHSWGYVEPSEAAGELLEEALEPFTSEMTRYLKMGLEEQAQEMCLGILLGLYGVSDSENDILGWAPDFAGEGAGNALDLWIKAAGRTPDRLSREFVKEHLPGWDWVLEERAGA